MTRRSSRLRIVTLASMAAGLVTLAPIVLVPIGVVTGFRARRLYAAIARATSLGVLRLFGVRLRVHQEAPFPSTQTVYISNHTSTLDPIILVALCLPNCRFFLSGFLQKIVPLGLIARMMGTFFTVPQNRPAERTRIFERAERVLRRTRESVYLSPEGGRITTSRIGHFNKGAFHLATNLRAPIVPMYFLTPSEIDPGLRFDARPGTVGVYVPPAIAPPGGGSTMPPTARVRDLFVRVMRRCMRLTLACFLRRRPERRAGEQPDDTATSFSSPANRSPRASRGRRSNAAHGRSARSSPGWSSRDRASSSCSRRESSSPPGSSARSTAERLRCRRIRRPAVASIAPSPGCAASSPTPASRSSSRPRLSRAAARSSRPFCRRLPESPGSCPSTSTTRRLTRGSAPRSTGTPWRSCSTRLDRQRRREA